MDKRSLIVKTGGGDELSVLGTKLRFLLEAEKTDYSFSVMEVELPKDQGPPPHEHPWDEAYYVIDGDVWFLVDGSEGIYSAGDFLYAPGGTVHAFRGSSDKVARVLVFDAPATAGKFFREIDEKVKVLPDDLAKIPEIGDRHQITFVPPGN